MGIFTCKSVLGKNPNLGCFLAYQPQSDPAASANFSLIIPPRPWKTCWGNWQELLVLSLSCLGVWEQPHPTLLPWSLGLNPGWGEMPGLLCRNSEQGLGGWAERPAELGHSRFGCWGCPVQPTELVHCCLQLWWNIHSALSAQALQKGLAHIRHFLWQNRGNDSPPKYSSHCELQDFSEKHWHVFPKNVSLFEVMTASSTCPQENDPDSSTFIVFENKAFSLLFSDVLKWELQTIIPCLLAWSIDAVSMFSPTLSVWSDNTELLNRF